MRLIRHGANFANPIGDADGKNVLDGAKPFEASIVIARPIADAMAPSVETGERDKEEVGLGGRRGIKRLRNAHASYQDGIARPP